MQQYKDEILDTLARRANVALFCSFSPQLEQRFSRTRSFVDNHEFASIADAIEAVLGDSVAKSVNIRSFDPCDPKSKEFIYAIKEVSDAVAAVHRLAGQGLHTIVNETIDVNDGGVSGVALGNIIEFAPGDTPRCVDKPGVLSMPRDLGLSLLETVYGFRPPLDYGSDVRVEFSIHPLRCGFKAENTIIWELEEVGFHQTEGVLTWPNRFSKFIGDKAFGLLVAHAIGLPVPEVTVISRTVAPFTFGMPTGCVEKWIRTCPTEPIPGLLATYRGWHDPFKLMQEEDPTGNRISSIISQAGVDATYSGALLATSEGELLIEGTRGFGDEFMVGTAQPTQLPGQIEESVKELFDRAASVLGVVRFEWVSDSQQVWIVQMHHGATHSTGRTIYPGSAATYHRFEVEHGLENLRKLIANVQGTDD